MDSAPTISSAHECLIRYAMVYRATDTTTGEEFALKKMICGDRSTLELANKEAAVMVTAPIEC